MNLPSVGVAGLTGVASIGIVQQLGDEIGLLKELTAFAALLVLIFLIGKVMVSKIGDIAPRLSSLQTALETTSLSQKASLDANTEIQKNNGAVLQKLVEQLAVSNHAMLTSQAALADRNRDAMMLQFQGMGNALSELKLDVRVLIVRLDERKRNEKKRDGEDGQGADS